MTITKIELLEKTENNFIMLVGFKKPKTWFTPEKVFSAKVLLHCYIPTFMTNGEYLPTNLGDTIRAFCESGKTAMIIDLDA